MPENKESEHDAWHRRQRETITVHITPTPSQRREIEWRACTGRNLNVETIGPRTAFRAFPSDDPEAQQRKVALGADRVEKLRGPAAPLWMYENPLMKVMLIFAELTELTEGGSPGMFRHKI